MSPSFLLWFHVIYYLCESDTYTIHPQDTVPPNEPYRVDPPNDAADLDSWTIQTPRKPHEWPFHLRLSDDAFPLSSSSSRSRCTLNLTIHGRKITNDARLFYMFGAGDAFFSFANDFDGDLLINGKKGLFIYPECGALQFAHAHDLDTLLDGVHGPKSLRQKLSQTSAATTATATSNWHQLSTHSNNNRFPVTFSITRDPAQHHTVIRFSNGDQSMDVECTYDAVFPAQAHTDLDVYIATDIAPRPAETRSTQLQMVEISKFVVAHECKQQLPTATNSGDDGCGSQFAGRVNHLQWRNQHEIASPLPYHRHSVHIDTHALSAELDIELAYLGYSTVDGDGGRRLGSTYWLDFDAFDAHENRISEPGACSNRQREVYVDKTWPQYWHCDAATNDDDDGCLAYPPPTRFWTMHRRKRCAGSGGGGGGPITYHARFGWHDLLQCRAFDGHRCRNIRTHLSPTWINLTAALAVDIVAAPLSSSQHDSHPHLFFVHHLDVVHFEIAVEKSTMLRSALIPALRRFTMSVAAVYRDDDDGGYKLVFVTESADYMSLQQPILLHYPRERIGSDGIEVEPVHGDGDAQCAHDDGGDGEGTTALLCTQRWQISIAANKRTCPLALTGVYALQWDAICTSSSSTDCRRRRQEQHGNTKVTLSTPITFMDSACDARVWRAQFEAAFHFYRDVTFHDVVPSSSLSMASLTSDDTPSAVFVAGVDTVFVALTLRVPLREYRVAKVKLNNVWLCHVDDGDAVDSVSASLSQFSGTGGCLSSSNIGGNGPLHVIQNYDEEFYFDAKHIDLNERIIHLVHDDDDDEDDDGDKQKEKKHGMRSQVVRFSFVPPKSMANRDQLFIHTQLLITLRPVQKSEQSTDQIRHFGANIRVQRDDDDDDTIIDNVDAYVFGGYQADKLLVAVIMCVVVCVIAINIGIVGCNKRNSRKHRKRRRKWNSEYDTEATTSTAAAAGAAAACKNGHDVINGLYTSHDENAAKEERSRADARHAKKSVVNMQQKCKVQQKKAPAKPKKIKHKNKKAEKKSVKLSDKPVELDIDDASEVKRVAAVVEETTDNDESDIGQGMRPKFSLGGHGHDTDLTTDIQTSDIDFSDIESKRKAMSLSSLSAVPPPPKQHNQDVHAHHHQVAMDKLIATEREKAKSAKETTETETATEKEVDIVYMSESEQEKRDRVKLIKQMIDETEIDRDDTTEYTQSFSEYSDFDYKSNP